MKRLALLLSLAFYLAASTLAAPPEWAQNEKKRTSDCGGPRQEPCPEPPPPDDPPSDPSAPYPDAPPCETHDSTVWHGVWDSERGCHYDHSHGVNPADTPFAAQVAQWESLFASERHEGYFFIPVTQPSNFDGFGDGLVRRALIRIHDLGTVAHTQVRKHTFRVEAEVCNSALTQCGVVSASQLNDYGNTHCPYKTQACQRHDDPWSFVDPPPYRALHPVANASRVLQSGSNSIFWQNLGPNPNMFDFFSPPPNRLLQTAHRSTNAWGFTSGPADFEFGDPPQENFICAPDFKCGYNNSRHCVQNLRVILPDGVGPGFDGWTDDNGYLTTNCDSEGPNCNRLSVSETVPEGLTKFNYSVSVNNACLGAELHDFDIYFGGVSAGWLRPPGSHDH